MTAHNKISSPGRGLVGKWSGNFEAQTLKTADGRIVDRDIDSEYKILDNAADILEDNRSAKVTINIFTEKEACGSCLDVRKQFTERYHNVEVNIWTIEAV
jgi:filamentous hemagglutinin